MRTGKETDRQTDMTKLMAALWNLQTCLKILELQISWKSVQC